MKLPGPILTLAVGALVAGGLLTLDLTSGPSGSQPITSTGVNPTAGVASTTPAPTTPAAPAPPNGTYAGDVDGGSGASIAIAVRNGTAVAYLCDGRTEAWLQGRAALGAVDLTGAAHASVTATFSRNRIHGSITAGGKTWTFSVAAVRPPSGLYRATAQVRNARVVGGWIVKADGAQVGVVDVDGTPDTAAPLDTTTLTSTVNDTTVTATPVDGSPIPLGQ